MYTRGTSRADCITAHLSLSLSAHLSPYLLSALFLFSMTMTWALVQLGLSVHTTLTCPGAWTLARFVLGEHVDIMQETTVQVFLWKPRATSIEVGMYLCWKM